jgi:outer membrane lipoprotein SlyB
MLDTTRRMGGTHPLIIVAATVVILTCLVALGMMTGVLPFSKHTAPDVVTAPVVPHAAVAPSTPAAVARTPAERRAAQPAVGSTSPTAGGGAVGGTSGAPAPSAAAPVHCPTCGTVVGVRTVKHQGDASMIGPAAGALLGGVLGHQIGHGTGNTIATVVGAGAGAAAGTEIERRTVRATTSYVIDVRMDEDGSVRHFSSPNAPPVSSGSKVRVVDGKLMMG